LGAEKFRVLIKGKTKATEGNWSEWTKYSDTSSHKLPNGININDVSEVIVQYYADNSAAYIVKKTMSPKKLNFIGWSEFI
jgi:hypothetical protein